MIELDGNFPALRYRPGYNRAFNKRVRIQATTGGVMVSDNTHLVGAAAELLVAADLMMREWAPYFPAVRNRGHDIIAYKGERVVTIEVRAAKRRKVNGELIYAHGAPAGHPKSDIMAIVESGEPVRYKPDLPA